MLKVFRIYNGNGEDILIATKSKREAAEIIKYSINLFNRHARITDSEYDIKIALSKPKTAFIGQCINPKWEELK